MIILSLATKTTFPLNYVPWNALSVQKNNDLIELKVLEIFSSRLNVYQSAYINVYILYNYKLINFKKCNNKLLYNKTIARWK